MENVAFGGISAMYGDRWMGTRLVRKSGILPTT